MKTGLQIKRNLLFLCILISVFFAMLIGSKASAAAVDYLQSNYTGTVTRDVGADLYTEPGSANTIVTKADGSNVHLDYGQEIFITGEEYDPDLDIWYVCQVTLDGVTYNGYVFTGRVTRGNAVEFTPTPIPTATPTPEEVATAPDSEHEDVNVDDGEAGQTTKELVEKSNGFTPFKYIFIVIIVAIVLLIVYTIWVKVEEEKLEREIERYSNRPQYEPLEGEEEDDYEQAKASYYDSIGLGNQDDRDLGDAFGNPDDIHLDMSGIDFDDNSYEEPSYKSKRKKYSDDEDSLEELIASLEAKLGHPLDTNEGEPDEDIPDDEYFDEALDGAEDFEFLDEDEAFEEEAPVEEEAPAQVNADPLEDKYEAIENLIENDKVVHKKYGNGVVIDNSDAEIIQIEFEDGMHYFKKRQLVKKGLIEF